ncbi:rod shape-determining protein MreC [Chitinibacteraceae bacterium HSL-7]
MHATQPAFFKQGPKPLTRLLIFSTLSLVLLVTDARLSVLQQVREQLSFVLYPLQWLATAPFSAANTVSDFLSHQAELTSENRELNDRLLVANAAAMRVHALEQENAQLRSLRDARTVQPSRLARVLYTGRDPFTAQLVVDAGSKQGVHDGQVVIDNHGLIGQVVRAFPVTSEVRLITNRDHMVPVMNPRSGLRAILYGRGAMQALEVRFVSPNADIKAGDTLVTSGLDGSYPPGIPVAVVEKVERPSGSPFPRIICKPIAGVDQQRFVLIVEHTKETR